MKTLNATIPATWRRLLSLTSLEDAPKRPTLAKIAIDDPTPYRDDQREISITPDPDVPEEWIDLRISSGDENYYCEAVLFDDGHDVDVTPFDCEDAAVRVGGNYMINLTWGREIPKIDKPLTEDQAKAISDPDGNIKVLIDVDASELLHGIEHLNDFADDTILEAGNYVLGGISYRVVAVKPVEDADHVSGILTIEVSACLEGTD